jgi:hypothetical protein
MEKEISELAYRDTASMTKKEKMNGIVTRLFFLFTIRIMVSLWDEFFKWKTYIILSKNPHKPLI